MSQVSLILVVVLVLGGGAVGAEQVQQVQKNIVTDGDLKPHIKSSQRQREQDKTLGTKIDDKLISISRKNIIQESNNGDTVCLYKSVQISMH